MDDKQLQPIVPRDELAKMGISAVSYLAGGSFLLAMSFFASRGLLGIILSVAALVIGIRALVSKDMDDRKPGVIITAAGVLGMFIRFRIPVLQVISGSLLGLGAIGLFVLGIWKGIKFLLGLKSRR